MILGRADLMVLEDILVTVGNTAETLPLQESRAFEKTYDVGRSPGREYRAWIER